ncbi:hypothetical protein BAE44_0010910 [Dichanthelium oligosanthes]|uniref:Uncharacterized protein n=1 Tax=Dichanthelium oligosanthes TaxID=888268 RepID=A0A1E5VSK6_9POAL|nr:hypothetical protein BAE44_0010910 [Dichanthelium oligosanthes]
MASVAAVAKFALTVAVGVACILRPILDILDGVSPRSAVLDAAVAVVLVVLPITYLLGMILLFLHVIPAPAMAPGAPRRLAGLACTVASTLLAVLTVLLVALMLLALAGAGQ